MFGYQLLQKSFLIEKELYVSQANDRVKALEGLVREYERENARLKKKYEVGLVAVDIGDPTPKDAQERRNYVARVAGFHKDIMEPKCLQMISAFHKLLEEETNDEKTDNILKTGIYICREWMKWGNQALAEQIANQVEPPLTPQEQKEEITQIKL